MIGALIGHLVGDYLLQNDWMAANKKLSTVPCAIHCALWASAVVLFAEWPLWAWFPLFVAHFIQDRTQIIAAYMHLIGQRDFATGACAPWSVIVVDNVWHVLAIWALWRFAIP